MYKKNNACVGESLSSLKDLNLWKKKYFWCEFLKHLAPCTSTHVTSGLDNGFCKSFMMWRYSIKSRRCTSSLLCLRSVYSPRRGVKKKKYVEKQRSSQWCTQWDGSMLSWATQAFTDIKKKGICTLQCGNGACSFDGDVDDADVLVGFVGFGVDFDVWDPLDNLHPFGAPSKHCVLVIQPGLQRSMRFQSKTRFGHLSSVHSSILSSFIYTQFIHLYSVHSSILSSIPPPKKVFTNPNPNTYLQTWTYNNPWLFIPNPLKTDRHTAATPSPHRGNDGDEELGAVGSRASVGHAEGVGPVVTQRGMELVLKLPSPDALSSHPCSCGVPCLDHEALETEDLQVRHVSFSNSSQSDTCVIVTPDSRMWSPPWLLVKTAQRINNLFVCLSQRGKGPCDT